MRVSVILNTYERADYLRKALPCWLAQTEGDFELLVADDGSSDGTEEVVAAFAEEAPFRVVHVWHEDDGHRRTAIINRAVERSRGDWLLMTDCDSLALPDLVEAHRRRARWDRLLCGGYSRLSKEETDALTVEDVRSGAWSELADKEEHRAQIRRRFEKAEREIRNGKPRRPHNMGLNYSVAREAFLAINGYDEEFLGWGSADGDVRERLRRIGVDPYNLYDEAVVLHMWHPTDPTKEKDQVAENRARARRPDIPVFCRHGIEEVEVAGGAAPADERPDLAEVEGARPGDARVAAIMSEWPRGRVLDTGPGGDALTGRLEALGFECPAVRLDPAGTGLPFRDASMDYVTVVGTPATREDPALTLDEATRVLRPGGRLVVATPNVQGLHSRWHWLLTGRHAGFEPDGPGPRAAPLAHDELADLLDARGLLVERRTGDGTARAPWLLHLLLVLLNRRYTGDDLRGRLLRRPEIRDGRTLVVAARKDDREPWEERREPTGPVREEVPLRA